MDTVLRLLHNLVVGLSRLLEPVVSTSEQLELFLRRQLTTLQVPFDWQHSVVVAAWVIVLMLLVRWLEGWLRGVAIVLIGLVVAKIYGAFPVG